MSEGLSGLPFADFSGHEWSYAYSPSECQFRVRPVAPPNTFTCSDCPLLLCDRNLALSFLLVVPPQVCALRGAWPVTGIVGPCARNVHNSGRAAVEELLGILGSDNLVPSVLGLHKKSSPSCRSTYICPLELAAILGWSTEGYPITVGLPGGYRGLT